MVESRRMLMEVDYYHLLGVSPNATRREIKIAYRRMAEVYHPDKLRHLPPSVRREGEDIMRLLNEAKSILLDTDKRYLYDCRIGNAENKQDAIIVQEFDQAVAYEPESYIAMEKEEVSSMMSRVLSGLREVFVRDTDFQVKIDMAQEVVEATVLEEHGQKRRSDTGKGGDKHTVIILDEEEDEIEMTLEFERVEGKDRNVSSAPGSKKKTPGFRIVAIEGDEEEEDIEDVEWED
jgi:curved DNA-binding protein CbpA